MHAAYLAGETHMAVAHEYIDPVTSRPDTARAMLDMIAGFGSTSSVPLDAEDDMDIDDDAMQDFDNDVNATIGILQEAWAAPDAVPDAVGNDDSADSDDEVAEVSDCEDDTTHMQGL